jgi:hypothetical protein
VSPSADRVPQEIVREAVAEIAESRGAIEQTKGILRVLAEQIAADFLGLEYDESLPPRGTYDRLLLTAHLRVPS